MAARARSNLVLSLARMAVLIGGTTLRLCALLVSDFSIHDDRLRTLHAAKVIHRWGLFVCGLAGIRLKVEGEPPAGGALIAPNHIGYCDIIAVAAVMPTLFLTRFEILAWPGIGYVLRCLRLPAVSRKTARDLVAAGEAVRKVLEDGAKLTVYLEGTSTGGDRVLPFMVPLLQAPLDAGAPVVPVAIRWTARDPKVDISEDVAYWKDHVFGPHILRFLGLRGLTATIRFGTPIPPQGETRKTMATKARSAVLEMTGLPDIRERADR